VDYELDWPPELLARELQALFDHPYRGWTSDEVELLLREAFHTAVPAVEFTQLHSTAEWTNDPRADPSMDRRPVRAPSRDAAVRATAPVLGCATSGAG